MKSWILAGAGFAALIAGTAFAAEKDRVSKNLDLDGFERIKVSGVYELTVEVGGAFAVEIAGPAEEVARVKASVADGVLELDQEERKRKLWGRNNHDGVDATITLPSLTGLEISGVVDGEVENIDADRFELAISGVGDIELAGSCGSLDASVSGVGDLDAEDLECRSVDVSVSGVGDASVFASEEVDARVSGMGDIDVFGSPKRVSKSDSLFAEVTVH